MNILKLTLLSTLIVLLNINSFGQSPDTKYKATMEGWEVSLEEARIQSLKTGKPILANFTGSDWCGWCIKLKRDVFVTNEFKKWAEKNVILLELDFPKRMVIPQDIKKQNAELAQAFGVRGYPTVWIFELSQKSKTGESKINGLATTGYMANANSWIKDIEGKLTASKVKTSE